MKTKTIVIIALVIVAIVGVWYFLKKRKKDTGTANAPRTTSDPGSRVYQSSRGQVNLLETVGSSPVSSDLIIGGVQCTFYGTGSNGEPVYNCNGKLKNRDGKDYGNA